MSESSTLSTAPALPSAGERAPDVAIGPFSAADLAAYAKVSGDDNPLHLDDELARKIGLTAPPVHGMKLLAAFEPMLASWRPDLKLSQLSAKFVNPALRGESVTLTARVLRASAETGVFMRLLAYGPERKLAVIGEATLLPRAPLSAAS